MTLNIMVEIDSTFPGWYSRDVGCYGSLGSANEELIEGDKGVAVGLLPKAKHPRVQCHAS